MKTIPTNFTKIRWIKSLPIVCLLFMALLVACEDPKEIGGDLVTTDVNTNYIDTFTVKLSTTLLDSNVTSQAAYMLVGQYNDPIFGTISSKAYAKFLGDVTGIDSTSVMDSVQLRTVYAYYYGDTARKQTINVHLLTEDLSTTTIYNSNNSLGYETTPIASATTGRIVKYKSAAADTVLFDTLIFKIKGKFANKMLQYAINPLDTFNTNVKGLVFVPQGNTNGTILGLKPTQTRLNVYAHYIRKKTSGVGDTTYVNNYSFKPSFQNRETVRFNQITANRGSSVLNNLRINGVLPAAKTNNLTYMQTALGVTTKIEIPYLAKFKAAAGRLAINQAILILEPQAGTFDDLVRTPFSASLARCTPLNQLIRFKIRNTQTGDSTAYLRNITFDYSSKWWYPNYATTGAGTQVYFLPDKKLYAFNLTSFLQSTLVDIKNYNTFSGIILMSAYSSGGISINNDINRAVFDARKAKLRVYFTSTPN